MSLDDPPKIIACDTLRDDVLPLADGLEVEFCEGLLHDHPETLRATLNERIAGTPGERTILLMYGRCSNGATGLKAGPHRLVLPAVDDCISLLLGSRHRYLEEFQAHPGTYYYTRGWIERVEDPYQEYLKMVPRLGEERARMVAHMILESYTRVALIDTGTYPVEEYQHYVQTVSDFYGLPAVRLDGSARYIEKLVRGPHDGEFIVVEPGGELDERLFWDLDES